MMSLVVDSEEVQLKSFHDRREDRQLVIPKNEKKKKVKMEM